ncbi:VWA domain-containing protein [Nostoc sp. CHAB 5834]|nr:VWA domain-containing protein [Nostoc sp. CHAB 5834]
MKGLPSLGKGAPRAYPHVDEAFIKEAINKAVFSTLLYEDALPEKRIIKLKKHFSTACWAFVPPHRIYLGTDILQNPSVKTKMTDDEVSEYLGNYFHHELAHAYFTVRNMKLINNALTSIKAPFRLFNLFEDAVIEERYRDKFNYRFNWTKYENVAVAESSPEAIMFALIQYEGRFTELKHDMSLSKADKAEKILNEVYPYYCEIIKVKQSLALMPIIERWLRKFGAHPQEANKFSDLMLGFFAGNGNALAEFDEDSIDLAGHKESPKEALEEASTGNDTPASSNGSVLSDDASEVDISRAFKVANRLSLMFRDKNRKVMTEVPQKRISIKHFVLGQAHFKKPKKDTGGKKNIFLVFDCSGSMAGFHADEGKLLVCALSQLAKQGHITGHIALSSVQKNSSVWETYALPLSLDVIEKIKGRFSGEGIAGTIKDNMKFAKAADYVFVYTDGHITDAPINKASLHAKGIYTLGLYVGDSAGYQENLLKHFDKAIIRDTVESLVEGILLLKR